jgi:apolipoprotein N-acyltransferase
MLDLYAEAAQSVKLRRTFIVIVLLAVPFLTLPAVPERVTVDGVTILGLDTSFGRVASGSGDFDTQYKRERIVFQHIKEMEKDGELESVDIAILPETIIGRGNPTTLKRWRKIFDSLGPRPFAEKGTVFVAGGEIPSIGGLMYDNTMISFESEGKYQVAKQRFPVPFSMYRPFGETGANAYLSSVGEVSIMEIQSRKLGFLVCYEQFLTWPFLSLISRKPDVIIAPSNLWWCRDTSLPGIRMAALRLWVALFGNSLISAANL